MHTNKSPVSLSRSDFTALASHYSHVPIYRQLLADTATPLGSYLQIANQPYSFLLESVEGGEKWGRYSIIGLPCRQYISVCGNTLNTFTDGQCKTQTTNDPLATIDELRQHFRVPKIAELPPFYGGFIGYFSYDTVRYNEKKLAKSTPAKDDLSTPDIFLMVSEDIVIFDNLNHSVYVVVHARCALKDGYDRAVARLDEITAHLRQPQITSMTDLITRTQPHLPTPFSYTAKSDYLQKVRTIQQHIVAGDVMQVVLSRRIRLPFSAPPINLYRALRYLNPSPYLYFLHCADFQIIGSSPEILARLRDSTITVRPIAGTRPRGADEAHDRALAEELQADAKEIAEHLMLIDIGRNDIARVAINGSVQVTEQMVVERYSHVMHLVSNIIGQKHEQVNALDVLCATLPAGTLSGAPKVRAMQIIDALEEYKRGIYGGAIGYIGWHGDMDTAITIRTAVVRDQQLYAQAGGGIVADSQPEKEWQETENKASVIFNAATLATTMTCHSARPTKLA